MSRHDTLVSLRQMLDSAREAVDMASNYSRADLDTNRMLMLALVRLCEVLGEAASRVPLAERGRMPEIAWNAVVGLRNRLIHGYDTVNLDRVWNIIQKDFPALITSVEAIIARETT